jgi:uncharacterized protein (TIGR02217 family)
VAFHNTVFQEAYTYGATGGPGFSSTVMITNSGYEKRNQNWTLPLRQWNIAHIIDTTAKKNYFINFFRNRKGMANSWLFKDWSDYQVSTSAEGTLGNGDGSKVVFQMTKTYDDGSGHADLVNVVHPKSGTVAVFVNAVQKVEGTDYDIAYTTGIITFRAGHVPPNTQPVYWTGEFYIQARFNIDLPEIRLDGPVFGAWENLPVIEVRE